MLAAYHWKQQAFILNIGHAYDRLGLLLVILSNKKWLNFQEGKNITISLTDLKCLKLSTTFNPITPMSDQDRIFPYNINTTLTRQVMRIKKNINLGIISWSNTKFSELIL